MLYAMISKTYGSFKLELNFSLDEAGTIVLFGKSGAGKTTLLNMLAGLVKPDSGRIVFGESVFYDSEKRVNLPPERRGLGFVFQQHRLFSHLSVKNNLLFGSRFCGKKFDGPFFDDVVGLLDIDGLLDRKPATLSGGESQRVAIGRALLAGASFLLMDEPLSSLDAEKRDELLRYIASIPVSCGVPILYVTHSLFELERLADRVLEIRQGECHLFAKGEFLDNHEGSRYS